MVKSNLNNFDKEFSTEVLQGERFRLYIIAAIFGVITIYLSFLLIFFGDRFDQLFIGQNPLLWIVILLVFFAIRSLFVRQVWSRWIEKGKKLPEILRYLNAALEISLPTIAILILGINFPSVILLHTPVVLLYFILIILSIFELEFKICFFAGSLAAIEYLILVYIYTGGLETPDSTEFQILNYPYLYIGKALLMFISGIVAGLVTNQIKGRIFKSFSTLEERNNIEKLFGQQVSSEIVDEIINTKFEITSKRHFVCIMFLDIRDFTPFSESKKPEEIIQFQNDVFSFMIEIINKNHGIINQFMGDGFMATFGAPVSKGNDCQNAVNAALEIEKELNLQIKDKKIPNIKIGIGLHAGDVVTGNVGTTTRKQYSVTGNVVILASRIEQLNKNFDSTILISKEVLEKIQITGDEYKPLGQTDIKGRKKPIEIFQAL